MTLKKKIILFGPYPPPHGGVSIFNLLLNKTLIESGFNCVLRIYYGSNLKKGVRPNFISIIKNFYFLKKNDVCIDSCSFFLEYPSRGSFIAWRILLFFKKFKWIKVIHDSTLAERYSNFSKDQADIFKKVINLIDELIVVNEVLADWLINVLKYKRKIHIISSLIPLPKEYDSIEIDETISVSLSKHKKIITSVGVFSPSYGFDHIVSAVELIRNETGSDLGLVLIDGCFLVDNEFKNKECFNRKWVTVLNNISHPQLYQILKKSDVFVRGTKSESVGLSRIEAVWSGTPVVATNVGEIRGMLLYEFGNIEVLVKKIKEAFHCNSKNNFEYWSQKYHQEAQDNVCKIKRII